MTARFSRLLVVMPASCSPRCAFGCTAPIATVPSKANSELLLVRRGWRVVREGLTRTQKRPITVLLHPSCRGHGGIDS